VQDAGRERIAGEGVIALELIELRPVPGSSWHDSRELSARIDCRPAKEALLQRRNLIQEF
jgi:hypothetical protein